MSTIIVTHENNEMDEYDFDVEIKNISIGRRSSNDVCVPHLSVSGNHCKITISDDGSMIEDLNSTNGTYINGRLISRQLLNDGDDIVIGKARLTFLQPETGNPLDAPTDAQKQSAPARVIDSDQVVEEESEPLSLAEKAALNLRPQTTSPVSELSGVTDSDRGIDDAAHNANRYSNNQANKNPVDKSEFAGDYYEPDDSEIKAMISDQADDVLENGHGDVADAVVESRATTTTTDVAKTGIAKKTAAVGAGVAAGAAGVAAAVRSPSTAKPAAKTDAIAQPARTNRATETDISHVLDDSELTDLTGAVIEIKNGAKSGQVLPIDKPVTTLGRPGIQIAAIMKKPEGYFLMHIESEDSNERPTLNNSMIGDDPVMLNSGDSLNVAGIDVEFMLS